MSTNMKIVKGGVETTSDNKKLQAKGAFKLDAGKPGVFQGLFARFPRALWKVAEVSTFGKNKYGTWNGWEDVEDGLNRYRDAEARHLLKEAMGEEFDPDSDLFHLAHKAWGALAVLELKVREIENETNLVK